MRILTIDVGTGTQDILLFDGEQELENSLKMVMPSPTVVVAGQIRAATERGRPILLEGVTMGGGPGHWAAPPGYSDRVFRFDYLAERVSGSQQGSARPAETLASFAYLADEIPDRLTRLRAVADSMNDGHPLLMMDTAPAAVLGALEDHQVSSRPDLIVANIGNFHCLAFRLEEGRIVGLFEHHTGELTQGELEAFLDKLIAGTITNHEVFDDMGHGALMFQPPARLADPFLAITGPR